MAVGDVMTSTGKTLTKAVTLPIVGMGIAAAKVGGDFEAQMSRVKAISGATGDSFEALRDQAIELGAKTAFSAKESAAGMENLASAGFDAKEIMQAMPGLLDLAAVSGGDVALASENAATALRGFNMDASQAGHVADVFAKAAADTNAEVGDMGEAMKYIAPVANSMGMSLEEVAAAVGIMSDAGIKGSQAGTTLRGALARLAKPTSAMSATMDELGINFYDANGNMKPLTEQVGMLKDAFKGLTPEQQQNALVTLYGQESLSGMMALIEKGPDSLDSLTKSLKQSDGAADGMARTMQDNTNSSLEQMMGAFESAAVVIQDILAPAIRSVADYISEMVDKFVSAPKSAQTMIVTFGLIAAAIGPVLFVIGKSVKMFQTMKVGILALRSGFTAFNTAIKAVSGGLKTVFGLIAANPIVLIVIAIAAAVAAFIYFWNTSEKFRDFWIGLWEKIKAVVKSAVGWIKDAWSGVSEWFSNLWSEIKETASKAWNAIKEAPGKAAEAIKNKWNDTKQFFTDLWTGVKETVSNTWAKIVETIAPYITNIKNTFAPLIEWFSNLWVNIQTVAASAWEIIKSVVMAPILFLIDIITGNFDQLKQDMAMIWQTISENALLIFTTIKDTIANLITALLEVATNLWTNFKNATVQNWNNLKEAAVNIWTGIKNWFSNVISNIVSGAKQSWQNFKQGTVDIFNAMISWIKTTWSNFKTWLINLITSTVDAAKTTWQNLKDNTVRIFNNIVDGAEKAWEGLKQGVSNMIDKVVGWFEKIKDINLWEAGKAIMDSLFEGLNEKWKGVQNFVGGIGDWIREHKGPIREDKKLLIPAGNAIMDSLNQGLNNGFKAVQNNIYSMNDVLSSSFETEIGSTLAGVNSGIQTTVQHEVNYGSSNKPAVFNIRLGESKFKAFVDDISRAQGGEIDLNMQF